MPLRKGYGNTKKAPKSTKMAKAQSTKTKNGAKKLTKKG